MSELSTVKQCQPQASTVKQCQPQASTVKQQHELLTPAAQRLLARIAPRFNPDYNTPGSNGSVGSDLIVMGPLPADLANAPKPPQLELYQRELELGEVVHFKPDRGFGHIDTANGHLFFHLSGYRVPSIHEYKEDGTNRTRHILQLERLPKATPAEQQPGTLCNPTVAAGDSVLFLSGSRVGQDGSIKRQAQLWTLQQPYDQFLSEQHQLHAAALQDWQRLAQYRLQLVVDVGHSIYESTLFLGTETSMLRDWYQHFRSLLNLNEHRRVVLACSEFDQSIGQHGPFVVCEAEVMEDFLG